MFEAFERTGPHLVDGRHIVGRPAATGHAILLRITTAKADVSLARRLYAGNYNAVLKEDFAYKRQRFCQDRLGTNVKEN
jgi:hypothetical protein